jgi:hypothetical protein
MDPLDPVLRSLFAPMPIVLWAVDLELRFTGSEGGGLASLGVRPGQVIGLSLYEFFNSKDPELPAIAAHRRALEGESVRFEQEWAGRSYDVIVSPLRDGEGRISGAMGLAIDETERKQLEGEVRQSQKLEALGRLAGGVAHEFNNLLTVMLGHTELLFPRLVDDGKGLASLREIRNAGRRAAQLTQQLMAFGRVRPLHPRAIDVASELSALVPVLSRLLGEDVVFPRPDLGGLPPVWMDPVQFGQILVGLALNAREAMPRGGEIRLEGVHHPMEDRVELLVMDTGAGIPPDILARLGEPFTTSKPRTPFAGLGLARIRSVVEQSSGKMSVESTVGKGTTVRLYLPVRRGAAPPSSVSGEGSMASASIVLVEDDEMVREFIGLCLEGWGHQVRSFGHPAEALRGIETKNFKADLLLTDVVLPGFSGVELSARARAGGAEFKVLYMSGYPEAEESGGPLARLPEPLLQKPFSTGQLRTALQAVLSPTP